MRAFRYKLPLKQPIRLGQQSVRERDGVLLEENDRWSEAAPLPNFSSETLADVIEALRGRKPHPPSLQFALDALRAPLVACDLPVNALLQGTPSDILAKSEVLSASACLAVKLKVGRQAVTEDVGLVRKLRANLRADQSLRLDANRAWDLPTALDFAARLSDLDIEYIEEPLKDPSQLEVFASEVDLPYALDETLRDRVSLEAFEQAAACVVKPTILGDRTRIGTIAKLGKPLVLSACYESGVGISQIVRLAHEWSPEIPAGLDTYQALAADVLSERLQFLDWRIHIPEKLMVKEHLLEELSL